MVKKSGQAGANLLEFQRNAPYPRCRMGVVRSSRIQLWSNLYARAGAR
jgi:hypothetical protein